LRTNYERLGYPPDAATGDACYTRYVSESKVLWTHTSAMIPALLRSLAHAPYDDVLLARPGLVYRRDRIDRLSVGEPHQLDLWRIRRTRLSGDDLRAMVALVIGALVPGTEYRCSHAVHRTRGTDSKSRCAAATVGSSSSSADSLRRRCSSGLACRRSTSGLRWESASTARSCCARGSTTSGCCGPRIPRVEVEMRDLEPYRPVSS